MSLLELRILPPLAIARLGASETPLENYDLVADDAGGPGFRSIVAAETLELDIGSGEIVRAYTPPNPIRFRDGDKIRPVAPFLEVFARTADDVIEPLTVALLKQHELTPADLRWKVRLGNRKIARRTLKNDDRIEAELTVADHMRHQVEGQCPNFLPGEVLPLGWVQYVKPTEEFSEIRLRYTPAAGYVYGASVMRVETADGPEQKDPVLLPERVIYDAAKGWRGYSEANTAVPLRTNPGAIFAGYPDKNQNQISWGYLDDECDGLISVELDVEDQTLRAFARVGAGPPTFAPDAIPIRTVHDELDQAMFGPELDRAVELAEAEEIVRRAIETVRLLNTVAINANTVQQRTNATSTMARQDSNDFARYFQPIMASKIVDNRAILALHQTILTALRSGTGAWFADTLRKPDEIGDLSDIGRRKMPAMMRGADGRYLTLTRRQINTIIRASVGSLFADSDGRSAQ
jgi:hypothetical protein